MILIVFLLLLSFIPVHPYMSDRFSAYEEYVWYQGIKGTIPLTNNYPVEIKESGAVYENNYSKFLLKKIDFEKTLKNQNIFLDASVGASYHDSIAPTISISPKVEFSLTDNIEASVKVFLSNDIDNSRGFPIKPFKEKIIAGFERGYVKYSNEKLFVLFGRMDYHSSFSKDNSLLFDYKAVPMDGIYLSGEANRYFSYDFKYASLGSMKLDSTYLFEGEDIDVISRYLSFHKIILTLKDYLRLSFSESCIFGRKSIGNIFDYTFPFFIFYGEQNNIDINDNILWAFDVNYNYCRVNLSYSLLVDDYQYEYEGTKDLEPPELGHIVRIDAPVCCAVMSLSYMRINAWVYNQRYPWNRYIFNSKNIGDEMGPDIQGIEGNGLFAYSSTGRVNFKVSYFEKGDNYSSSDWIFPISDTYYYKQIGIDPVKKWTEASLSVEQIYKFLSFNLSLNYLYGIENTDSGLSVDSYIRILL